MRQKIAVLAAAVLVLSLFAPAAAGSSGSGTATTTAADATQVECEYPIEVTDATGETITLEEPPESVVALQPSDARTVFEIGAEDRLVGVPDNPGVADLETDGIESVTDGYEIQHETVIDLDPDVVLAANTTFDSDIQTLRDAGLTVYQFDEARSIDDVRENTNRTGELTGECAGAAESVQWMDDRLEIVTETLEGTDRPLAYYPMGADGTTPGTDSFIHDVLTTAGVEDLSEAASGTFYPKLSEETIVEEDPEWIVYPDDADEPRMPDVAEATSAYQSGNLVAVDSNQINQPTPQVIYPLLEIVGEVHAEASADMDGANETDDENETNDGESENEDTIPGFGVPIAVAAALAAVGILARRR
ncbi:periplasmic binding protein [Haloterrigena salina JCM 13891]|uniref:Periplasmic binding protein n=1 Tax=Haloterrigena salina JCM 13891 TaxID=1227488 RepID=M0C444_9EURY|nr:PGF-CTERM-anchored ABC transporter substrate-binding protein [Haloterrigena salina]ELZ16704.1 periplasmic binding protein [Haloterrigena salina JCM 13891]